MNQEGGVPAVDVGLKMSGEELARLLSDDAGLAHIARLAEMGLMTSGVVHELRQPLFSIKGYLQMLLLESHQRGAGDERLVRMLEWVEDLERSTQLLLDFARQSGDETHAIALRVPILTAIELFRMRLSKQRVAISVDVADSMRVLASPSALQHVFVNLLQNSLHALRERDLQVGRHIWIRAKTLESGDSYEILFADNGSGIDPAVEDQIFDLFFTTRARGEGTGLGLPIVRRILHRHRGEIQLRRGEAGLGNCIPQPSTVFVLTLPALISEA